jgi:hypothetical protein
MRVTSPTDAKKSSSMRCRQGSSRRKSLGMAPLLLLQGRSTATV